MTSLFYFIYNNSYLTTFDFRKTTTKYLLLLNAFVLFVGTNVEFIFNYKKGN